MGCRSTLITPIEDAYGLLDASANFIYFTYSFLLLNYFLLSFSLLFSFWYEKQEVNRGRSVCAHCSLCTLVLILITLVFEMKRWPNCVLSLCCVP